MIFEKWAQSSNNLFTSDLEILRSNILLNSVDISLCLIHISNLHNYFKDKWKHLPEEAFEMLTRKGVYPYSYMNSFKRFEETSLPEKSMFYNDLKKHIKNGLKQISLQKMLT